MSSFRGRADEPFSLSRAVDAMRDAARSAGRPATIWLAGLCYPTLQLGFTLGLGAGWVDLDLRGGGLDARHLPEQLLAGGLSALLLAPILARLAAGLARVVAPPTWSEQAAGRATPTLRSAWRAGRGTTLSAAGLWILLGVLQRGATLLVLALAAALTGMVTAAGGSLLGGASLLLLAGPAVALVALYAVLLSTLHQLALHSLVHNRRGVASALLHAWRIARRDPLVTSRAVATDLVLYLVVAFASAGARGLAGAGAGGFVALALGGFAGVTRAGFWARAYRALGGLSPDDGVPGLAGPPAPSPEGTAALTRGGEEGW